MLSVDVNWKFEEAVNNIDKLRDDYVAVLSSFSYFKLKDKIKATRNMKNILYSLKLTEFEKNLLWQYMNDDIEYEVLIEVINNRKMKKRSKRA